MSSTYTAEDLPEYLRDRFAAMTPQMQQMLLASMTRLREHEEPQPKIVVPEAPLVDERELMGELLFGHRNPDGQPLPEELQWELDAQLGTQFGDRSQSPYAYNQPVRMLTVAEAAGVMGVSITGARRLIRGRGLPSLRLFKTVRVRSDHAWAMRNRLAAGIPNGGYVNWRPNTCTDPDRGLPIDEVAAIVRVHPHTMWRWMRRFESVAAPGGSVAELPWRCAGPRAAALIPADVLSSHGIPFEKSKLQLIRHAGIRRYSGDEKKRVAVLRRRSRAMLPTDQVRRADKVRDAASGQRVYKMDEAATMLNLTVSGARKAIARAGIDTWRLAGADRVRHDDLFRLLNARAAKVNRRMRPWFTPDHGSDPLMVPIAQAARRMGVTVRTLRRRGATGKLTLVTFGEQLWVRRHDVIAADDGAERAAPQQADQEQRRRRARRGALTEAHIEAFLEWLHWRYPDVDRATAVHTRAGAAAMAGCRPSVIEALVAEGLIPAQRQGRDVCIRTVDLIASGVFSAKVARMCPKLAVSDPVRRRSIKAELLTFDQAALYVSRPASEVRYLAGIGALHAVRFGTGAHRLHESEVTGPGLRRFNEVARPYRPLKFHRHLGWGLTVNDASNHLGVCERTVLRWICNGALLAVEATRKKWVRSDHGVMVRGQVPVNHGGFLVSERSVRAALRLRQIRGQRPREVVPVTAEHLRRGTAPALQPWQRYLLLDENGHRLDEYGNRIAV